MSTARMSLPIRVGRRPLRDHRSICAANQHVTMAIVDCALIKINACRIIQSVRVTRGALNPAYTQRCAELTALSHLSMTRHHYQSLHQNPCHHAHTALTPRSLRSHRAHSAHNAHSPRSPRVNRAYTAPMSAPTLSSCCASTALAAGLTRIVSGFCIVSE